MFLCGVDFEVVRFKRPFTNRTLYHPGVVALVLRQLLFVQECPFAFITLVRWSLRRRQILPMGGGHVHFHTILPERFVAYSTLHLLMHLLVSPEQGFTDKRLLACTATVHGGGFRKSRVTVRMLSSYVVLEVGRSERFPTHRAACLLVRLPML